MPINVRGNYSLVKTSPMRVDYLQTFMYTWDNSAQFYKTVTVPILRTLTNTFIEVAARNTPPGKHGSDGKMHLGNTNIEEKYYYCLVQDIQKAIKDPANCKFYIGKEGYQQYYKHGNKFRVLTNKYRHKKELVGYYKTYRTAHRKARIANRGLCKYSWGSLINNFSGSRISESFQSSAYTEDGRKGLYASKEAPMFRLLAQKSPNITRYQNGAILEEPINMAQGKFCITITNQLFTNQPFISVILQRGTAEVKKRWLRIARAANERDAMGFQRALKADMEKVFLKKRT